MNIGPDRLALLRAHATLTGIAFVDVDVTQTQMVVHFHNPPSAPLQAELTDSEIDIAPDPEDGNPAPDLTGFAWTGPVAHRRLSLSFAEPGPFSHQRLTLIHPHIDPYFGSVVFSFKANCPSPFDCKTELDCPQDPGERPRIDYQARDFDSYRKVLFDYAATHWPDWTERHEADVGVMMMELMAALGDELAYYQDRVAREAYLGSATQPRSLRSLSRLVAHEIAPPLAGGTLLDVQVDAVAGNPADALPAGTPVWAETQPGERVSYEVGRGLADIRAGLSFDVDAARNVILPHLWDEDQVCLFRGATEVWVKGALAALLPLNEELADGTPARTILLRTDPDDPDDAGAPAHRILMQIIAHQQSNDPLTTEAITRLEFAAPTPVDLDFESLSLRGNLVPATAGMLRANDFVVGAQGDLDPAIDADLRTAMLETIERQGARDHPLQRLFLDETDQRGLAWLSPDGSGAAAVPEIDIASLRWTGAVLTEEDPWTWRRSFMGAVSSFPDSLDYTLEDGRWAAIRTFMRPDGDVIHRDYASPFGQTVRFGDGEFGLSPARGTMFRLRYRIGGGAQSNLGPETIRHISDVPVGLVVAVSNPLAVTNGAAGETAETTRIDAPQAWKSVTYRAVRPEDYSEAAERLDWVDHAATRSLWTGSWQTMFTTPDPRDMSDLPPDRRHELEVWLDRFRQTGRDVRVADPVYADLDFEITVCADQSRERSDVARRIRDQLSAKSGGFFDPNQRSFGDGVERARLEAAIHDAGGVRAVESIRLRRRGWFDWREMSHRYRPEGGAEIIRVETNPDRPDRGSVSLLMEGGS